MENLEAFSTWMLELESINPLMQENKHISKSWLHLNKKISLLISI